MPPQIFKREEMIKVAAVARRWKVSRQHIYNLIRKGDLPPAFRFGSEYALHLPLPAIKALEQASLVESMQKQRSTDNS